ncbi:MAG TPA: condensation domain-containing protein, partial [Cytophagales bacterium]
FEIWGSLLNGGSLYLVEKEALLDTERLGRALDDCRINTLWLTSCLFNQHAEANPEIFRPLQYLLVGGEPLNPHFINKVRRACPQLRVINGYGPTENTTFSVCHPIEQTFTGNIPIGRPIGNATAFVCDPAGNLLPVGIAGELWVGGDGVALGYLNNEALTRRKFVRNPRLGDGLLYRTGDLARWLPDGTLEFLGRLDNQVKIRGFRIEPGEIEKHLVEHPRVKEAAVVAWEKEGEKHLVAYYVADTPVPADALQRFASERLPDFMVPARYVHLPALPLTGNGKLDRRALPEPRLEEECPVAFPAGSTEEKLAALWADVLKVGPQAVGPDSNFFALGGHSIKAFHLVNRVGEAFSLKIGLRTVFENPTVRQLAGAIRSLAAERDAGIPRAGDKEGYPASSAQERLYYEQMLNRDSLAYNISGVYRLAGEPDPARLERTFRQLIERHETLRTVFALSGEVLTQRIGDGAGFKLEVLDHRQYASVPEALRDFIRPFDLTADVMIRCGLLPHPAMGTLLFVDMHHIVCDGLSLNILMADFRRLYQHRALPPLPVRYVDYACWQRGQAAALARQREYWAARLAGELPRLNLPVMQDREGVVIDGANCQVLAVEGALYEAIKRFTREARVSDFMFLLSAYYILLAKLSGETDVIVGTDAVGRTHPDLAGVVGTFVNELPLRVEVADPLPYLEFLAGVKECVLGAFDHQEYQFDQIVALVHPDGPRRGNPVFDVHFSFSNTLDPAARLDDLQFERVDIGKDVKTQYEFKLEVHETGSGFRVAFITSTDLYDPAAVELFMVYYQYILTAVLEDPSRPLQSIALADALPGAGGMNPAGVFDSTCAILS